MSYKQIAQRASFALALMAAAVPAMAAEAAEGHAEGPPNLFAGDLGNVVWTVAIFVLVLVVLGKFAWGPLLNALQARESFIHDALARAKRDRTRPRPGCASTRSGWLRRGRRRRRSSTRVGATPRW